MTEIQEGSKVARVNCKCVFCKHIETIQLDPYGDPAEAPMCPKCYSPMYALSAEYHPDPEINEGIPPLFPRRTRPGRQETKREH